MIQRVVLVELKPAYAGDASRQQIAAETRRVLRDAHGVVDVEVGLPADGRTGAAWDLCILVRFASRDDVERYRTDPVHRAYADVFLKPLRDRIAVFNFDVGGADADSDSGSST